MTLSSSDIQAIAQAVVESLRREKDVYAFAKKRAMQTELLNKKALTLSEVARAGLLGDVGKVRLWQRCQDGTYTENIAWYKDTKGKIMISTEFIKNERKMLGL